MDMVQIYFRDFLRIGDEDEGMKGETEREERRRLCAKKLRYNGCNEITSGVNFVNHLYRSASVQNS